MRSVALVSLALTVACVGCSLNPATNKRQLILTSEAQEKELGRRATEEVEQAIGYVDDPRIAAYVSRVGETVAEGAPDGQFDYEFRVVEMEEPNAFAVPGGYVFVSRGLLALTNSEAELAGILGHEVGHVAARHGTNQASVQAPLRVVTGIGAAATGIISNSLGDLVSGMGGAATDALFSSYGRDQEREADQLGQRFMASTGYDPAALSSALDSLHQHSVQSGQDDGPSFFSSHPSTPERVDATRQRAAEFGGTARPSTASRSAHVAELDGLRMGPDPDHGVFLGAEFLQPAMDFRMRFPEGWETINGRDFVAAQSKTSLLIVSLVEGDDPMEAGRAVERRDGVDLKLRAAPIGTLSAARGEAKAKMEGRESILDVAWIAHGERLYQLVGVMPVSGGPSARRAVSKAVESFRPMTASDRARIPVERLRITAARGGETVAAIAARTGSARSVRELEVLNGVSPGVRLRAGESVKIVREERY